MALPSLFTFSVQFTCVHGYLPVAKLLFHTLSPIPVSDFIIICTVQSSLSYIVNGVLLPLQELEQETIIEK